jgi:chaperonin GroEL
MACCAGIRSLVLLATKISERALSVLVLPANRRRIQVVAVKAPVNTVYREDLEDMAVLVGGRPLLEKAGDKLEAVRLDHLGRARRAWADKEYLGMEAGQGDPRKLRQHIAGLRQALARTQKDGDRKRLQQRLGKLIYGSAIVWIGATTPLELEMRKELAKRTMEAMRGALREGVLPGGGAALLDLRPVLQEKVRQAQDTDERVAYKLLQKAVEVPIRTLLNNSGHPPESILAQIAQTHSGYGFDVTRGELRDMRQAGIVDAASVVKTALGSAIQSAALALTIDVLIQRANPPMGVKRQ